MRLEASRAKAPKGQRLMPWSRIAPDRGIVACNLTGPQARSSGSSVVVAPATESVPAARHGWDVLAYGLGCDPQGEGGGAPTSVIPPRHREVGYTPEETRSTTRRKQ